MTEIDRLDAVAAEAGGGSGRHDPGDGGVSRRTPTNSSPPLTRIRSSVCRWPAVWRWPRCGGFDTDHLRLVGLHSHIGSQIFEVDGFELAAHRIIGLLRDVVVEFGVDKTAQLSTVDLGGGLGISYLPTMIRRRWPTWPRNWPRSWSTSPRRSVCQRPAGGGTRPGDRRPGTVTLYEVGTVRT